MFELTLLAAAGSADEVSDRLLEAHGALSVSVEDAEAGSAAEQAKYGEPGSAAAVAWERSVVKALFADSRQAETAATRLLAAAAGRLSVVSIEPVIEQDWVRLTQAQFGPTEIAPGFWVVPTWHQPPAAALTCIRLDPGMAFGTGTHPTTRMCLRWIARRAAEGARWDRALDYGCGSGILAIAAALHGVADLDAVDIDPEAVTATALNAAANRVSLNAGSPDAAHGRYSLVLANILATPLALLAPLLASHLAAGGELVLAGILQRQATDIASHYRPWLDLAETDHDDGWVLMTGRSAQTPMA